MQRERTQRAHPALLDELPRCSCEIRGFTSDAGAGAEGSSEGIHGIAPQPQTFYLVLLQNVGKKAPRGEFTGPEFPSVCKRSGRDSITPQQSHSN